MKKFGIGAAVIAIVVGALALVYKKRIFGKKNTTVKEEQSEAKKARDWFDQRADRKEDIHSFSVKGFTA